MLAKYPIIGSNYISHSNILVEGYTAEQVVEFYFGVKQIKHTLSASFSVTDKNLTKDDRYNGDTDKLIEDTYPKSGNASKSLIYNGVRNREYAESTLDWIIPPERCCPIGDPWSLTESYEQFDNSLQGAQNFYELQQSSETVRYNHSVVSPLASNLWHKWNGYYSFEYGLPFTVFLQKDSMLQLLSLFM